VAVRAAEVICALTIQRCVAPGSTLYAQRWFPRTALPELLGVAPAHFHNTRIHRVLDKRDRVETELQDGLVRRYEQRDGTFATLFTDVTDAWFEGRGPDLAQRSRTKEGLHNRHKIGILLLCNEHGYPLRWSTLSGRTQDGKVADAPEPDVDADKLEGGALWLYRARAHRAQLEDKTFKTQSEIAKHLGVTRARMTQLMTLLRLDEALQKEVLAGNYGYVADRMLRAIVSLRSKAAQRRALVAHGASARPMDPSHKPRRFQHKSALDVSLRRVLYFNPQLFVDMRAMGERHRAEVDAYVQDVNARLGRKGNEATRESAHSDITGKLASRSMLSIYTVQIDEKDDEGHKHLVVSLAFDHAAWNKRRSTDGFVLLVAQADLPQGAAELVALYRAKDAVEQDFQTIKSDPQLRPVFHHTDPKVRAHVSLCMLALLLERSMERRLRNAGKAMTAPATFEEPAGGHLNQDWRLLVHEEVLGHLDGRALGVQL